LAAIIEAVGAMLFHTVARCYTAILYFKFNAIATQVAARIFVRLVYQGLFNDALFGRLK
jgi:hypothetical protein